MVVPEKNYIVRRITESGRIKRITTRLRKYYRALFGRTFEYTLQLNYTVKVPPELANKKIQNITLELPDRFHREAEYELSCSSSLGKKVTAYRKFSRKMHTHNYEEPRITILPSECTDQLGQIIVRAVDYKNVEAAAKEFSQKVIFRATAWAPGTEFEDPTLLEVYLPQQSYLPGEKVDFHVHATDESTPGAVEIFRLGSVEKSIQRIEGVKFNKRNITAYSYRDGLDWPVTASITLPQDLKSGYYMAVVDQGNMNASFAFIVRPHDEDKTKIAIVAATNTWNAYNGWNGGSFYRGVTGSECLSINYAPFISTKRPMPQRFPVVPGSPGDHLLEAELMIPKWLEKNDHDYVVYSDYDLNKYLHILDNHEIVILPSHPEYYTREMYDAVQTHVDRGGDVLSLGGNVMYYRVTMKDDKIEKYTNSQKHEMDGQYGGFWSQHLDRSPAALIGNEYDARDYATHAPFKVTKADHWIFSGTGLKNGDLFADKGSGHEIDVVTDKTPANAISIAKGQNPNGYGADMVWIDHAGGGKTFAVGSISFSYTLGKDSRLDIVMNNVIRQMLDAPAPQNP